MTEPAVSTEPSTPLQRYEHAMRRRRTVYYAVLAVIVIAFATVFTVVVSTGEAANATLHTVSRQPATLATVTPSAQQTLAWRTTDRTALGTAQWSGTVITWAGHTVRGRDARTGAQTWSYTRSDRTLCDVVQLIGRTIAIYQRGGACDEVSAFDSGTGERAWTRTLDKDGAPVEGHPTYQFTNTTLLVTTRSVIYAIDPVGGIDRWTYSRYGCTINRAVLGSAGALISQTCSNAVRCATQSFCRAGRQLLLRDGSAGDTDDKKNPDMIIWNDVGNTGVPVSADAVISAVQPGSNVLDVLAAKTGKQTGTVTLDPAPADLDPIVTRSTDSADLVWIDGHITALATGSSAPLWTTPALSAPSVVNAAGDEVPAAASARVTVATSTGIATLNVFDGRVSATYDVGAQAAGSTVVPLGSGFLVSAASGTVAYR